MFELFAGRPVFEGPPVVVLHRTLGEDAPRLSTLAPDAPPDIVEACAQLLLKAPSERPPLEEIGPVLCWALGSRVPQLSRGRSFTAQIVGREDAQAGLRDDLARVDAGGSGVLVLEGPPGTGKTTLATWLGEEATRLGWTVLSGRGRPNEHVAFNAIDGAMDALAVELARRRRRGEELDVPSETVRAAASAFGVLARALEDGELGPEAPETDRHRAFDAVTALVAHEARASGAFLLADDVQWADDDSIALLEHILDAAPPGLLVVMTARDDGSGSEAWEKSRSAPRCGATRSARSTRPRSRASWSGRRVGRVLGLGRRGSRRSRAAAAGGRCSPRSRGVRSRSGTRTQSARGSRRSSARCSREHRRSAARSSGCSRCPARGRRSAISRR